MTSPRMNDQEILDKLDEIARRYNQEGWPLYDLTNDLEELFAEMDLRADRRGGRNE
jgi:hypothetical protein